MLLAFFGLSIVLSIFLFFNRNKTTGYLAVIFYVIILWAFGIWSYISRNTAKYDYFVVDSLAALMIITLCIVATAAFFHSYRYLEKYNYSETPHTKALFLASLVVLCTSIAASFISNHLAISWIFIELTTLSSSVLIYHHRNIRALEGVWKYVFVSAIGITLVYLGILFLSIALKPSGSQDLRFDNLYILSDKLNTFWLKLAFIFIFTGFTVKMGLVPLYTVGIDAKDKAPAPAGAIFASVLMNTGFIAIYRFYALVSKTPVKHWADSIIIFSAFLSLFIAAVYMTRIKNIKRMFAYSGIEHMGIIMIGLVSGGIGIYAAILHILLHSLIKPSLFFQYNQIYWVFQSKSIYDVGNYIKYNKTGAVALFTGFIFITAIPPSGLFISELLIFKSLFLNHMFLILFFMLITITIIIWGLGSNVFKIMFSTSVSVEEKKIPQIKWWESLSQFILPAITVYIAYFQPEFIVRLFNEAILILK